MHILRNTPDTLELRVYDGPDLADLDATPSLAVTDANGDAVTTGAVSKTAVGVYEASLDGQADLKALTAVWSGVLNGNAIEFTEVYEVTGNLLFTEAEARGKTITGQQTPLSDTDAYPARAIKRMRTLLTQAFERETGRSQIRRYCRVELPGSGTSLIDLTSGVPRDVDGNESGGPGRHRDIAKIIAATIDGTAVDVNTLEPAGRRVHRQSGVWNRATRDDPLNVVIEYEYGLHPVPIEANENGLIEAVNRLQASDVSRYAQTFSRPDGATTFPTGGFVWASKTFQWLKGSKGPLVG